MLKDFYSQDICGISRFDVRVKHFPPLSNLNEYES
jgi:hypothetical protein